MKPQVGKWYLVKGYIRHRQCITVTSTAVKTTSLVKGVVVTNDVMEHYTCIFACPGEHNATISISAEELANGKIKERELFDWTKAPSWAQSLQYCARNFKWYWSTKPENSHERARHATIQARDSELNGQTLDEAKTYYRD